jgi:gas vesicle protein
MKKETNKKLAIGAVVGLVTGYVTGILTAPKSGKETRQDIKNDSTKALHETEKRLKELHKELSLVLEQAAAETKKLKGQGQEKLDELMNDARVSQKKVKEVLSAIRQGDAEDPELKAAVKQAAEAKKHLSNYIKKS